MARRKAGKGEKRAPSPPPLPAQGTVVEVAIATRDHGWPTRIEWVDGWSLCVIAPLRADGEVFPVEPGTVLTVGWPTELGFFEATATLRELGRDVVATWILDATRIDRRQRRSAYRLPLTVPITLRDGQRQVSGSTCDISEGGLRCSIPKRQAPVKGSMVEVELVLPDVEPVLAKARVVRFDEMDSSTAELGLFYVMVDAAAAEQLRRFVFAEQLRRRGANP